MQNLQRTIIIMACAINVLFSCKKPKQQKTDIPSPVKPIETVKHNYVPVKFEGPGMQLNLKYKDQTGLLTEIADQEENTLALITYTDSQLPYKMEKYRNGKLFYVVYYIQEDKKVTSKALPFDFNPLTNNYTPLGFYMLTYNIQQKINAVGYYNRVNKLTHSVKLSYTDEVLSESSTVDDTGEQQTMTYNFDHKTGISSCVSYADLFAFELNYWFFLFKENNILIIQTKEAAKETVKIQYEYNEQAYPSNILMISNGTRQNIKITYKSIDP